MFDAILTKAKGYAADFGLGEVNLAQYSFIAKIAAFTAILVAMPVLVPVLLILFCYLVLDHKDEQS